MKIERTRNAKRNVLFGLIYKVINILLPFIVRTAMMYTLGMEYLGLSSLFTSILTVLNLTELGVGSAIVYHMYKAIAEDDEETICALLNFYKKVYRVIGIIVLAVGLILIPFLPHLIKGGYPSDINLSVLYILYLVDTVSSYLLFAYYNSLLNAFQRNDITSNIASVVSIVRYVSQALILLAFRNYELFILVLPVMTIVSNIITAIAAKRMYPQYTCRGQISKDLRTDITVKVKGMIISKVQAVTRNSFDSIFISAFLGLGLNAIYGNYYYIMESVIGVLFIFTSSITSGVGNSVAMESVEKNYADMNKINFVYMWISGWCTICMLCLYQPFMLIWAGREKMFPVPVMLLFCIYFYSLKIGDIRFVYFDVNGLWWENRYKAIAEAVSNIVLNYILGKYFGVYGILTATIITILVINFGYGSQIVFQHYFGLDKLPEYFRKNLVYLCMTLISGGVTYVCCSFLPEGNIIAFAGKMCICVILPNIIYFALYFRNKDFKIAIPWIIRIMGLNRIGIIRRIENWIDQ